ncbi:hypothetical protein DPEC_G00198440 [Dallia pectoralis]|uniref:Uncharacterized protein n=1 Tax=Dallia pectoralis TaxID=75939 RepID=A0ACC2G8H7_DALPE|nr:hypothetical protein DPEC_G00198440 [Dallia pectoralis]
MNWQRQENEFIHTVKEELDSYLQRGNQKSVLLFPPLPSRLRYLIHTTTESHPSLATFSVGESWCRRVVVCYSHLRLDPGDDCDIDSNTSLYKDPSRRGRVRQSSRMSPSPRPNPPARQTRGNPKRPDKAVYVPRAARDKRRYGGDSLQPRVGLDEPLQIFSCTSSGCTSADSESSSRCAKPCISVKETPTECQSKTLSISNTNQDSAPTGTSPIGREADFTPCSEEEPWPPPWDQTMSYFQNMTLEDQTGVGQQQDEPPTEGVGSSNVAPQHQASHTGTDGDSAYSHQHQVSHTGTDGGSYSHQHQASHTGTDGGSYSHQQQASHTGTDGDSAYSHQHQASHTGTDGGSYSHQQQASHTGTDGGSYSHQHQASHTGTDGGSYSHQHQASHTGTDGGSYSHQQQASHTGTDGGSYSHQHQASHTGTDEDSAYFHQQITAQLSDQAIVEQVHNDYSSFTNTRIDHDQFAHVIEIYNFPAMFKTDDLLDAFSDYSAGGLKIKWVDDTHALGVFSSQSAATHALSIGHPLLKTRTLSNGSHKAKGKAVVHAEFIQPVKERPRTDAVVARRMVTRALGRQRGGARPERF